MKTLKLIAACYAMSALASCTYETNHAHFIVPPEPAKPTTVKKPTPRPAPKPAPVESAENFRAVE